VALIKRASIVRNLVLSGPFADSHFAASHKHIATLIGKSRIRRYLTLNKSDSAHIWSINYMRKSVLASVRASGRTIGQPPLSGTDLTASSHRSLHRPP